MLGWRFPGFVICARSLLSLYFFLNYRVIRNILKKYYFFNLNTLNYFLFEISYFVDVSCLINGDVTSIKIKNLIQNKKKKNLKILELKIKKSRIYLFIF